MSKLITDKVTVIRHTKAEVNVTAFNIIHGYDVEFRTTMRYERIVTMYTVMDSDTMEEAVIDDILDVGMYLN